MASRICITDRFGQQAFAVADRQLWNRLPVTAQAASARIFQASSEDAPVSMSGRLVADVSSTCEETALQKAIANIT